MEKFPCTKCGACCQRAGKLLPKGTVPLRENGSCAHLGGNMECTIYETRPLECRVNAIWKVAFSERTPLKRWHKANAEECNKMIKEDGLGDEFLVKVD